MNNSGRSRRPYRRSLRERKGKQSEGRRQGLNVNSLKPNNASENKKNWQPFSSTVVAQKKGHCLTLTHTTVLQRSLTKHLVNVAAIVGLLGSRRSVAFL